MKAKPEMELLQPVRGNPLLTELVVELEEAERIWGEHFVVLFDPSELAIVGLPKEAIR